jgi:hypothetical protein
VLHARSYVNPLRPGETAEQAAARRAKESERVASRTKARARDTARARFVCTAARQDRLRAARGPRAHTGHRMPAARTRVAHRARGRVRASRVILSCARSDPIAA